MDCLPHIHISAWHAEPGFESAIPGIGALCKTGNADLMTALGVYRNSIARTSAYAGAVWQPVKIGQLQAGAFAGVVSGYRSGMMPFAAGVVTAPMGRARLHFTVIPKTEQTPATVALSASFGW